MQKYSLRCNYCGHKEDKLEWLLKLKLVFKDTYYHNCPKCHKVSCYKYFFHLRHDSTDSLEKNRNREKLWDDRYG